MSAKYTVGNFHNLSNLKKLEHFILIYMVLISCKQEIFLSSMNETKKRAIKALHISSGIFPVLCFFVLIVLLKEQSYPRTVF